MNNSLSFPFACHFAFLLFRHLPKKKFTRVKCVLFHNFICDSHLFFVTHFESGHISFLKESSCDQSFYDRFMLQVSLLKYKDSTDSSIARLTAHISLTVITNYLYIFRHMYTVGIQTIVKQKLTLVVVVNSPMQAI